MIHICPLIVPRNVGAEVCDSNQVVCEVCGTDVTPGFASTKCNGGAPPPTVCYTDHVYTEPAAVVGQAVPANIQQKLVDASQLAAITYCQLVDSFTYNNFCSSYANTELLLVWIVSSFPEN